MDSGFQQSGQSADSVTFRPVSMFAPDIEANKEKLTAEIKGKKVCVIGDGV